MSNRSRFPIHLDNVVDRHEVHDRDLFQRALHHLRDPQEPEPTVQEGVDGDFICGIQYRRSRTSDPSGLVGEVQRREGPAIRRVKR